MNSISAKEFLITTVLVSAFVGFSYGIDCYYCDPTDKGCDDPIAAGKGYPNCDGLTGNNNPMTRVLDQERERVENKTQISYICGAVKVSNKQNKTFEGIYRTCLLNTTTADHCKILKNEFENEKFGQVVECLTCDEALCNSWTLDNFKNSSPESFTSVLLYTFLSCFFVVYVI
ncbi:uncharacterized protein LOC123317061 [Coccinella septempunctata]|uniref:uncharacterized protein LOC123317061 n=1 Tax=Coccinella septempunctata TaxID=41139 RepID=UPI001D08AB69|nr:uncharacterized protein LOC123317061 [Coccinella septempunctata]